MKHPLLLLTVLLSAAASLRAQQSTLGEGDSYAWAANLGWIEMIPNRPAPGDGIVVTDTHLFGFAWSDSTGWINFGDGTPANGVTYSNNDGTDSGVNHDGAGNLSGLAWSANIGWINFGWAAPADANRPRFDLISGNFSGYAWGSNAGWITLGTGLLKTDSMCVGDADNDGISDAWEFQRTSLTGGGEVIPTLTTLTATGDADGDGVSDLDEYYADTNPFEPSDHLAILDFVRGATASTLTWTSRPTRLYHIGQTTDLASWLTGDPFAPDAGDSTARLTRHDPGPRRFFKVEAVVPLQK